MLLCEAGVRVTGESLAHVGNGRHAPHSTNSSMSSSVCVAIKVNTSSSDRRCDAKPSLVSQPGPRGQAMHIYSFIHNLFIEKIKTETLKQATISLEEVSLAILW